MRLYEPKCAKRPQLQKIASEIAKSAAIDKGSAVPGYVQLRDALRHWLASREVGQRLPPERLLASVLGVALVTVKTAVRALAKEGLLQRSVKGTFIVRLPQESADPGHPFLFSHEPLSLQSHLLKIVVFETWPGQRPVWTRLADLFNQAHPRLRLEVTWLQSEINTYESYRRYIQNQRPDVVLVSMDMAHQMKKEGLLAPLPPDLSKSLRGPGYSSGIPGIDRDDVLSYAAPLHMTPWGVLWNEDRVAPVDGAILRRLNQVEFIRWLTSAGPQLPPACMLVNEIVSLQWIRGFPTRPVADDELRRYFEESFEAMASLQAVKDKVPWRESFSEHHATYASQSFLSGKSAFYAGNLWYCMSRLGAIRFRWNGAFLIPAAGCRFSSTWNGVAIPTVHSSGEQAEAVVRFLVGGAAQDEIAAGHLNMAFRRQSNRNLLPLMRGSDETSLESTEAGFCVDSWWNGKGYGFLSELRPLCHELLDGTCGVAEAVGRAMEQARERGFVSELAAEAWQAAAGAK